MVEIQIRLEELPGSLPVQVDFMVVLSKLMTIQTQSKSNISAHYFCPKCLDLAGFVADNLFGKIINNSIYPYHYLFYVQGGEDTLYGLTPPPPHPL